MVFYILVCSNFCTFALLLYLKEMKQLLITLLLATTTGGYAQKFLSDNEITEQVFGTEKLYKLEKTGDPLDGAYKVALGGGAYYERLLQKL